MTNDALTSARNTLKTEAAGLQKLAESIGDEITAAVDMLAKAEHRVIVSGMGKSGHIANKITATMASTGTPAQFVHPAEASHGDLGMITPDDVVLALSWSGSTQELASLLNYTKRFNILGVIGKPPPSISVTIILRRYLFQIKLFAFLKLRHSDVSWPWLCTSATMRTCAI